MSRPTPPPQGPRPPAGPNTPPPPPGPKGSDGLMHPVATVARMWGCSVRHIYNLVAAGELAVVDIGHGRAKTRIPQAEVERYIAAHTRRASKGRAA